MKNRNKKRTKLGKKTNQKEKDKMKAPVTEKYSLERSFEAEDYDYGLDDNLTDYDYAKYLDDYDYNQNPKSYTRDLVFQTQNENTKKSTESAQPASTRDLIFEKPPVKKIIASFAKGLSQETGASSESDADHTNGHGPYLSYKY